MRSFVTPFISANRKRVLFPCINNNSCYACLAGPLARHCLTPIYGDVLTLQQYSKHSTGNCSVVLYINCPRLYLQQLGRRNSENIQSSHAAGVIMSHKGRVLLSNLPRRFMLSLLANLQRLPRGCLRCTRSCHVEKDILLPLALLSSGPTTLFSSFTFVLNRLRTTALLSLFSVCHSAIITVLTLRAFVNTFIRYLNMLSTAKALRVALLGLLAVLSPARAQDAYVCPSSYDTQFA